MTRYIVTIILTICVVLSMIYRPMVAHLPTWISSDYTVLPQDFQMADKGNPQALTKVGDMYFMAKKYAMALPFYTQAHEKKHAPASLKLAKMYQNGQGTPQDKARANEILLESSLEGNIDAFKNLGENLKSTFGIK